MTEDQPVDSIRGWKRAFLPRRILVWSLFPSMAILGQAWTEGWASVLALDLSTNSALRFTLFVAVVFLAGPAVEALIDWFRPKRP